MTFVFVTCMLATRFCSAFVLPGAPIPKNSGCLEHSSPSVVAVVARGQQLAGSSDGQAPTLSWGRSVWRYPSASELCAASADSLDEDAVLAKFKRLQVK